MKNRFIFCIVVFVMNVQYSFAHVGVDRSLEDSIWSVHAEEILAPLQFQAEDVYVTFVGKYKCEKSMKKRIHDLCFERERRKYLYNYMDISVPMRIHYKAAIDSIYQDSINRLLIPTNHMISGQLISLVLGIPDILGVDSSKYQQLMDMALEFARRKASDPCAYLAKDEIEVLKNILSRKQVERAINIKNYEISKKRAENAWQELSKAGIVNATDSIQSISKAITYYRKEMLILDYFVDDRELIDNNLRDLYMQKPKIINMYEGLLQKAIIEKKHHEKVGEEFAW